MYHTGSQMYRYIINMCIKSLIVTLQWSLACIKPAKIWPTGKKRSSSVPTLVHQQTLLYVRCYRFNILQISVHFPIYNYKYISIIIEFSFGHFIPLLKSTNSKINTRRKTITIQRIDFKVHLKFYTSLYINITIFFPYSSHKQH